MTDFSKLHVHVIGKRFGFAAGRKTNYYCLLNGLSATVKLLCVKAITDLFGVFNFFERIYFETQLTF